MVKDYKKRLEKLQNRRFDDTLQKSILSESFKKAEFGESLKYALEAMLPIDESYNKNTYLASEKIQNNLTNGLAKKNIAVTFRHQGSVETNTNIKLYSDIDLLVITTAFESLEQPQVATNPYKGSVIDTLKELREESFNSLDAIYNQVDNSKPKAIQVFPTNPKRKVDVVIANWFNSNNYKQTGNETFRGIQIYNKETNTRTSEDFTFLHISKVNAKDNRVNGGLKKLVRLLKTLKVDADYNIDLTSFEITSLLYDISDFRLNKQKREELLLLREASLQLDKLITNTEYRDSLKSPNDKEFVFKNKSGKVVEFKKLKLELDELIQDISEEMIKFRKGFDNIIYS